MRRLLLPLCVSVLLFASCSHGSKMSPGPAAPAAPVVQAPSVVDPKKSFTVIAITDFHGALEAEEFKTPDGKPLTIGGAPLLASYIEGIRAQVGPSALVDGGDLFQGTMASNLFEGAPVVKFYNHLKVAAAALGNHEFDYGPIGPKSVPRSTADDARGALKQRMKEARFPILAANVRDETGKRPDWIDASKLQTIDGVKVGFIGAADEKTPTTTNALNLVGLRFLPPLDSVREEAEKLRRAGAQVVILTIHSGGSCENNALSAQDDLGGCGQNEAFSLARNLPEGLVNVIVAGHTHRTVVKRIGKTVILQAGSSGKYVAWASVPLDGGRAEAKGLLPVCAEVLSTPAGMSCDPFFVKKATGVARAAEPFGSPIAADEKVVQLLKKDLKKVEEKKLSSLNVEVEQEFTAGYDTDSPLGNLVADLTRRLKKGVDIGMANGGGLRAPIRPGALTYGAVFKVLPFDNQFAIMHITGEQLRSLANLGRFGKHGSLTFSENVRTESEGCEVKRVFVNGKLAEPENKFRLATSDYLAGGGSGVGAVGVASKDVEIFWDQKYVLRDMVAEELKKHGPRVLRPEDFAVPGRPRHVSLTSCSGRN